MWKPARLPGAKCRENEHSRILVSSWRCHIFWGLASKHQFLVATTTKHALKLFKNTKFRSCHDFLPRLFYFCEVYLSFLHNLICCSYFHSSLKQSLLLLYSNSTLFPRLTYNLCYKHFSLSSRIVDFLNKNLYFK